MALAATAGPVVRENARAYRPEVRMDAVVVQKMAHGDVELVLGLKHDPAFGPVIMAGLVEVLKDVAFRRCPLTSSEAERMLDELHGKPPVNRKALVDLLCAVSRFGAAAGARLEEMDLNPVLAGADGAVAVDCALVLSAPP